MHVFSNSVTSVTNLNLERYPVKMGGRVLLQPPLTAVSLSEEENSLWKITLPPT